MATLVRLMFIKALQKIKPGVSVKVYGWHRIGRLIRHMYKAPSKHTCESWSSVLTMLSRKAPTVTTLTLTAMAHLSMRCVAVIQGATSSKIKVPDASKQNKKKVESNHLRLLDAVRYIPHLNRELHQGVDLLDASWVSSYSTK